MVAACPESTDDEMPERLQAQRSDSGYCSLYGDNKDFHFTAELTSDVQLPLECDAPISENHKKAIRRHFNALVDTLDVPSFLRQMMQDEVVTENDAIWNLNNMTDGISQKYTRREKVTELLTYVLRSSERAYYSFLVELKRTYFWLYEQCRSNFI